MDIFVGRETELQFLEKYYNREGSHLLVVYGSRGVGKTRLMREFGQGKQMHYYLATSCSSREQQYRWACEMKESGAEIVRYPSWEEIFHKSIMNVSDTAQTQHFCDKQIFVIDEFHHIVKSDASFFGALCDFVNQITATKSMLVILSTSASGWVENSMVDRIGNRASNIAGFLKVRSLTFRSIRNLFPKYPIQEAIRAYAVLGGNPGYWKNFSDTLSADENMIQNIIPPESKLHEGMSGFLDQELREPAVYNTILATLAGGCFKLNDIYKHTGFSRAKISVYLKTLMELDLVEKVYSYETEGYANAQKGIYRISNPYVWFYFKYLFPNQSLLQFKTAKDFFAEKVKDSYNLFVEETYRKICREVLADEFRTVGEWVGKTGTLDAVAKDAGGKVCVASCSYGRKACREDYEWLLFSVMKAKLVPDEVRIYCELGFDDYLLELERAGKVRLLAIDN